MTWHDVVALARALPEVVQELVEDAWAERPPERLVEAWAAGAREEAS